MINTLIKPFNILEMAEFLLEDGSSSNLNFAFISTYEGKIKGKNVKEAILHLQKMHPLLRATVDTSQKIAAFVETNAPVPFTKYPYKGGEQWNKVVKEELSKRFSSEKEPLWRVCFLKGENKHQVIFTFHHGVGDAVCAAQAIKHFCEILSDLLNGKTLDCKEFSPIIPDPRSLKTNKELVTDSSPPLRSDCGFHMNFAMTVLDETITQQVLEWTKMHEIKVHGTLFAAFLLAVHKVIRPPFYEWVTYTAVNYRPFFNPPISKEIMTLIRTCISSMVNMEEENLEVLAKIMHHNVHSQLKSGEHILNIKITEQRLQKNPTPQEWWRYTKFPGNSLTLSNIGALDFSGEYTNLTLKELFFVANVEPFIEERTNFMMGALTFRNKTFLTIWFLNELVEEETGKAILAEMKSILSNGTKNI